MAREFNGAVAACIFGAMGIAIATALVIDRPLRAPEHSSEVLSPGGLSAPEPDNLNANAQLNNSPTTVKSSHTDINMNPFAIRQGEVNGVLAVESRSISPTQNRAAEVPDLRHFRELFAFMNRIDGADSRLLWATATSMLPDQGNESNSSKIVALSMVLQKLAERSPDSVLNWLEIMNSQSRLNSPYLNEILLGIATLEGDVIAGWLKKTRNTDLRSAMSALRFQHLASVDPESALEWFYMSASDQTLSVLDVTVLERLIRTDPQTVNRVIENLAGGENKDYVVSLYVRILAESDPVEALQYAVNLTDEQTKMHALLDVMDFMVRDNATALSELLPSLPDDPMLQQVIQQSNHQIAYAFAQQSQQSALEVMEWASVLPTDTQTSIQVAVFEEWLFEQPVEATEWLRQQDGGSTTAQRVRQTALGVLPSVNLDYALEAFDSLSRNEQESIAADLVYQLHQNQPADVKRWIETIDHPDVRRLAQQATTQRFIVDNPDQALHETLYLEGDQKIDRLIDIVGVLGSTAPEKVELFMAQYPLSAQENMQLGIMLEEFEDNDNVSLPAHIELLYTFVSSDFE